ncbi:hypothetical protein G7Y89_g8237 [Cudoniella acicularis]|uniref:Uncharacterized protein n=1 Tax=Cudoniella acicularis TaxID=354080 RepID=A0A8H4RJR0_9HELO|nr:hypothetical protein G7Y89_g8237 [Cudoniella acicularis]
MFLIRWRDVMLSLGFDLRLFEKCPEPVASCILKGRMLTSRKLATHYYLDPNLGMGAYGHPVIFLRYYGDWFYNIVICTIFGGRTPEEVFPGQPDQHYRYIPFEHPLRQSSLTYQEDNFLRLKNGKNMSLRAYAGTKIYTVERGALARYWDEPCGTLRVENMELLIDQIQRHQNRQKTFVVLKSNVQIKSDSFVRTNMSKLPTRHLSHSSKIADTLRNTKYRNHSFSYSIATRPRKTKENRPLEDPIPTRIYLPWSKALVSTHRLKKSAELCHLEFIIHEMTTMSHPSPSVMDLEELDISFSRILATDVEWQKYPGTTVQLDSPGTECDEHRVIILGPSAQGDDWAEVAFPYLEFDIPTAVCPPNHFTTPHLVENLVLKIRLNEIRVFLGPTWVLPNSITSVPVCSMYFYANPSKVEYFGVDTNSLTTIQNWKRSWGEHEWKNSIVEKILLFINRKEKDSTGLKKEDLEEILEDPEMKVLLKKLKAPGSAGPKESKTQKIVLDPSFCFTLGQLLTSFEVSSISLGAFNTRRGQSKNNAPKGDDRKCSSRVDAKQELGEEDEDGWVVMRGNGDKL